MKSKLEKTKSYMVLVSLAQHRKVVMEILLTNIAEVSAKVHARQSDEEVENDLCQTQDVSQNALEKAQGCTVLLRDSRKGPILGHPLVLGRPCCCR